VSYLRTSNRSDSRHSWAILALLVKFIRQYWPDTRIVFRGDSGFYRPRLLSWCDRNNVDYLVGLSKNSRLLKEVDVPSMLVRKYAESCGWLGDDVWFAHLVHCDEHAISRLAATGTGIAHCPTSNCRLGSGIAPVIRMARQGVPVSLGGGRRLRLCRIPVHAAGTESCLAAAPGHPWSGSNPSGTDPGMGSRGGARLPGLDDTGVLAPGKAAGLDPVELTLSVQDAVSRLLSSL